MNMHGVFVPESGEDTQDSVGWREAVVGRIKRHRMFVTIVLAPLAAMAVYLYVFASNQYESEAHFMVRTVQGRSLPAASGVGQLLSLATGSTAAQSEAMSVADYLTSHDAVEELRRDDDLVGRFRRANADFLDRLWSDNPTPERLLTYYRRHVIVEYGSETGITTLKVRSFSPQDSYQLLARLLQLGEGRVNILNRRSYSDAVATSRRQLAEAEDGVAEIQGRMTRYRADKADIDPAASGQAQIGVVSGLTEQLASARAQLSAMGGLIDRTSPQYRAVAARVTALAAQVAAQSGRLAGGGKTIASDIGGYEDLKIRQQFAAKRYEAAAASLQEAREQALRQQLYIVRIVNPNVPVKSTYPKRLRILGTAAVALLLAYAIVWLLIAGVKEHAA